MWISNTATAAMMLAIARAVLQDLEEEEISNPHGNLGEPPQSVVKYAKRCSGESGETSEEVTVELGRGGEQEGSSLLGDRESESQRNGDSSLARISKVLVLGVAYSANIGGTATLTGTGPNIILSGLSVR